ncbi:MAG: P22 phage major capsid protein family protein, partial [Casimicrobium sp.]
SIVTGLDISASAGTDLIQRLIPTVFRQPDNVLNFLDAKEMRDPTHKERIGKAAALRLAAEIDKNRYQAVAQRANIVVKKTGAITWDDGATAEALMISRGIPSGSQRKMFLNAFDYRDIAKELGNRAYIGDVTKDALERSRVPNIAGFETFRTDNQIVLPAIGTVTGTTVSVTTAYTPTSMTGDVPTDNRQMALVVAGANIANIKNGDAFTIAGVNAVHQIDKTDTGQPLTLRVVSGAGTANLVVSPPICATGPYQNATAVGASGAAITFLNTASRAVNAFWSHGAVCLDYGRLAFPDGQGAQVMTANTKNGVPLTMAYQFNSLTGRASCRFSTLYAATVRDPMKAGIIIANQP